MLHRLQSAGLQPRAAAQEANSLFRPQPSTSNSLPNRAQRHRPVQPPSPVELIIPVVKTSGATVAANSPPIEPSVAETIVLPKKTDKLDFTRRWLHDDLSSLAHQPPANIAPDVSIYQDVDEHSLGSCSAEVAAICSNKRDRSQKKSTNQQQNGTSKNGKQPQVKTNGTRQKPQQQSQQQPGPVRPQPFRPQPVYALPNGNQNNNGVSRFPAELEPPQPLARVASFDNGHHSGKNSARAISQEPYQTLGSARSDEPGCRPSPSAFHNVPSSSSFSSRGGIRGSLRSLPDAGLLVRQKQPEEMKDPVLAIDQLVAELELNTEQMSVSDKRRSFPTSFVRIQNDYEQPVKQRAELRQAPMRGRAHGFVLGPGQIHQPPQTQSQIYPQTNFPRVQRQEKSLDEVTSMLNNVVNDFQDTNQPGGINRKKSTSSQHAYPAVANGTNGPNPFETINHEKINPSRVEQMHNMFERGTAPTSWKIHQPAQPQPYKPTPPKDEEQNYYEINEFQAKPYKRVSPPRQMHAVSVRRSPLQRQASFVQDYVPAVPTSNPPQHPPGSASSSQNGGYYSSNSSGVGVSSQSQPGVARRSSFVGRQSISSHAPSVDDDDDGFYDNIGTFDDRRFSRGSDLDTTSMSSRHGVGASRHGSSRGIGSFLKRIGGSTNGRTPQSAASMMSLNKVAQEPMPSRPGALMKSNSLSMEPWKTHVINHQQNHGGYPNPNGSQSQRNGSQQPKSGGGLGARLKHSLFGSKKRLN
ncbi:hypothetical protein WR25_13171 [Diploscapter pachys]|uniref:Uncharacterized protein n=1 Tax=Diploscapter pachys TaxID=2018661 RepID=A0A2A2LKW6_9BILA|nr:hypothetical protein WR25_13171 [Diploscapter pachys]